VPSSKDRRSRSENYRKPPVEHQFKKGRSGNPNGRPKKKSVPPGLGALGGGLVDRLSAMALHEATRPVTVREGDTVSEIPALQALFRAMFRAAAQGDTKAGRQLLEVIARTESERVTAAWESLERAIEHKAKYQPIFEEHERRGLDPPDIYPHPDDLITDMVTGKVTFAGPMTKEEAGKHKELLEIARDSMPRYAEVEAALKEDPANRALQQELKELEEHQKVFEIDAARNVRHMALRLVRRAAERKASGRDDDTADDKHDG
jgi:hypothetical protein